MDNNVQIRRRTPEESIAYLTKEFMNLQVRVTETKNRLIHLVNANEFMIASLVVRQVLGSSEESERTIVRASMEVREAVKAAKKFLVELEDGNLSG